ncbi:hypothetical protein [Chryseosolibacter indicus]|uniref:NfeD-like C-terminal domain-containing protein n=1 Tax=Chryseosolibacter indicus TaxID=2782351 RepID=A0ABS5VTF0_9BACT|nr:hypothetical protein [Chryseosolibacter indicus]MBT1704333.1 hypothetical protein [Chryseosolibacter indicus]
MWTLIISLLLIGLALVVIELIFIPGSTIVGVLGALFAVFAIVISYKSFGRETGFTVLLVSATATLATLIYSFKTGVWSKLSLKTVIDSKVNEGFNEALKVGDIGKALSTLRPIGKAEFDTKQYEVKTSGEYIESGVIIRIKEIYPNQIIVEPLI